MLQDAPGDALIAVQVPGYGISDGVKDYVETSVVLISGYFIGKTPFLKPLMQLIVGGNIGVLEKQLIDWSVKALDKPSPVRVVTVEQVRKGRIFFDH